MTHKALIEAAEEAINEVHSDTQAHVSLRTTLGSLERLRDHVSELIDAVKADIKLEEREE